MSKKECFDDVIRLFKSYENTKRSLSAEYEGLKNSGMYSRQYLDSVYVEHDKKLRGESSTIYSRIGKIREKLEKELDKEFDLTASRPDSDLVALVNSGIVPTEKEFVNLAQKYKGNYVNSRLLHDFADRNGFILRNVTTREEAEQAFDNFTSHVCNSTYNPGGFPTYTDSGMAQIAANSYLNNLDNPALDCYKKPNGFEEAVAQGIAMDIADKKRREPEIDDAAFLRGFWGEKAEKAKTEEEQTLEDCVKALTAEELADAKWMAKGKGHGEYITQEEIDYIHSDDYKRVVAEREAEKEAKLKEESERVRV